MNASPPAPHTVIQARAYESRVQNNIRTVWPVLREDEALIEFGSVSHTTCPYYVYENFLIQEAKLAMRNRQIPIIEIQSLHQNINSVGFGSGPEGSIRFGDDMIPGLIVGIVAKRDLERAQQAWYAHQRRKYADKPHSCLKGGRVWNGKDYVYEPTRWWRGVVENAIFLAQLSHRPTLKLKTYHAKHFGAKQG